MEGFLYEWPHMYITFVPQLEREKRHWGGRIGHPWANLLLARGGWCGGVVAAARLAVCGGRDVAG